MQQIQIMRDDPVVVHGGSTIRITGRPSELFRLLILSNGTTVTKHTIATLRETSEATAASKIRYLRSHLASVGCEALIENDRSIGYRATLSGEWFVDASEFRTVIEGLDGAFDTQLAHTVNSAVAQEEVTKIEQLLRLWNANPGVGLAGSWEAKFDRLKRKAEDRLLKARLCTREPHQIREAIQDLEHRSRSHAAEDVTWQYLLLAYHALGTLGQVDSTWVRIDQYYKGKIPVALQEIMRRIGAGGDANPFRIDSSSSQGQDAEWKSIPVATGTEHSSLAELCTTLGIMTASELRLEGSHLTPLACIRRTRSRLYFMGVLASKWVTDAAVRSEFKQLLSRLDAIKGDVRFLIIDPQGDGFRRLSELRKGHVSTESLGPLRKLAGEHASLQVRMYSNLPAFRIIVIDDDVVSFSAYRLAAEAYLTTDRGWESPHVVLDPLARYPLSEAFQLLFLETWESARPLGDFE